MKKIRYIDDEERELIESIENAPALKRAKNERQLIKEAKVAARNYRLKNARINIRMSESDLAMLKMEAAREGLPYQTLISSILHKYIAGHLKNA